MEAYINAISLFNNLKQKLESGENLNSEELEKLISYKAECVKHTQYHAAAEIRDMERELYTMMSA